MKTDSHPKLTGDEIRTYREELGLSSAQMMHSLGYSSAAIMRLRERMHEFELEVKPLPPGQTRALLMMAYISLNDQDALTRLLDHGDFLNPQLQISRP